MAGNKEGTPFPKLGDMVAFNRPCYDHFGIYVGGGEVVHITKEKPQMGIKSTIKKESLEKVAGGGTYKVCNQDDMKSPLKAEEIVKRANERVGQQMLWGPFSNCETLASELRYGQGKGHSEQALKAADFVMESTHNALNPGGF